MAEHWRAPEGESRRGAEPAPESSPEGTPTAQDTATLAPVSASDPSWAVMLTAALVSFAFLVGVMVGASGRGRFAHLAASPAGPAAKSAVLPTTQPGAQASTSIALTAADNAYYMGASTSPDRPMQPPLALPASAAKVYYHYSLPGWPADAHIGFRWSLKGKPCPLDKVTWRPSKNVAWAQGYFELSPPGGAATFAPGIYEVELSGPGDLREVGSFAVVDGLEGMMAQKVPPGGILVGRPVIALEVDNQGRPTKSTTQVPPSVRKLYACFTYDGAAPGTLVVVRWFYKDVEVEASKSELRLPAASGQAYATLQVTKGLLPVGNWKVAVYLRGVEKPRAEAAFVVSEKAVIPGGAGAARAGAERARPAGAVRRPAAR